MWKCKNCGEVIEDSFQICWNCGTSQEGYSAEEFKPVEEADNEIEEKEVTDSIITSSSVMLTTTSLLPVYPNLKILGVVCSQAVAGKGLFMRSLGNTPRVMGISYESYMSYVEGAREEAVNNIIRQAIKAEANAIMGIKIEYSSIGNGVIMVSATGTAVIVQ